MMRVFAWYITRQDYYSLRMHKTHTHVHRINLGTRLFPRTHTKPKTHTRAPNQSSDKTIPPGVRTKPTHTCTKLI